MANRGLTGQEAFSTLFFAFLFTGILIIFDVPYPFYKEADYVNAWCNGNDGVKEYRLPDRTRVDCLTDDYAIEFDYARKWKESIGQALHYARLTDRRPAVMIIIQKSSDIDRYVKSMIEAVEYAVDPELNFKIMMISVGDRRGLPGKDDYEVIYGE